MIKERYTFQQSLCKLCVRGLQQPLAHRHQYQCQIKSASVSISGVNGGTQHKLAILLVGFCRQIFCIIRSTLSVPREKTGPPVVGWQVARASSSSCLCADTPEFSWPAAEPAQQQGGRQTMCGHWSIALRARTLEDHPLPIQSWLGHSKVNNQRVMCVCVCVNWY